MRFKRVIKNVSTEGYFKKCPAEDLSANAETNKNPKEILYAEEYTILLNTPLN